MDDADGAEGGCRGQVEKGMRHFYAAIIFKAGKKFTLSATLSDHVSDTWIL
jgi:hypothetical protein